jgi:MHS family shikimate/dehydroshikimate transporter-like MFS transporter
MTVDIGAIVFAGAIGTIIEWYDFLIYGTAAALVFNTQFFPNVDPRIGTLAALGSFTVGFVARPIGGAIFGHFGDRLGRKSMLMLTMIGMGLATALIGLLPTYDQIGIWAPVLLVALRVVQGIALGGEWGGASLMVLEHAPPSPAWLVRQPGAGRLSDRPGIGLGGVLAGLAAAGRAISRHGAGASRSWSAWCWSALASSCARGCRRRRSSRTSRRAARSCASPLIEMVLRSPRNFLVAIGLKISEVSWVYMLTVFVVVYATTKLTSKSLMLNAISLAALLELATIPLFGHLSDRYGRRPLYFFGVRSRSFSPFRCSGCST